jgi:hypothetical protein
MTKIKPTPVTRKYKVSPIFIVNRIIDSCHVSTSNFDVLKKVMAKVDKEEFYNKPKQVRKEFYKYVFNRHDNNFNFYAKVMSGSF